MAALGLSRFRQPSYDVRGRTVLVTGAGQGIGREIVRIAQGRGASVAAIDIDQSAVQTVATECGDQVLAIAADVTDREAMVRAIDTSVNRFGRLDVVVANAAVLPNKATIRMMDPAEFDRVLAVNLTGVFNTVRPALGHIVDNGGHVVAVCSCAAFAPGPGYSPYFISKAGVEAFGRTLRVELAATGASAGVAYFGVVDTAMADDLVNEEFGRGLDEMMPWPLNVRATARQAAMSVVNGIARRAVRTYCPAQWSQVGLVRGVANLAIDHRLSTNRAVHKLIRGIE
ncbi:short-chain dehydrogenase/reductase [Mycobacteroides abscessus]|uniref:short-chain dehydrogenase/reductase n=1 Tax=Mycobacteroides abscessus TaxID=36809 RepID=UPI0009D39A7E|nr:short-chain dehydrogenase/reductase [Mycobacteroides abscessus]SLG56635.1 short-chain alcohol dehydrogenase [Mycobacteroides abscessus subsp. abscessus]